MVKPLLYICLTLCVCVTAKADDNKPWRNDAIDKNVQAACDATETLQYPASDMPGEQDKPVLKDCASSDLYYGVKMPVDYTKARKCAFVEKDAGDDMVFGGSSVLMMLYANGYGVEKNFDLAIKAACIIDGSQGELEGRVKNLQALKTTGLPSNCADKDDLKYLPKNYCSNAHAFDVCDDITSGMMDGFCTSLHSGIENTKKDAKLNAEFVSWPLAKQQAFKTLRAAADAYFDSHSKTEIDLAGSSRGAFVVEENDKMTEAFRLTIRDLEHGKLLLTGAADFASADKQLNIIYGATMKKIMANKERMEFSGITKDGVRDTEKLWIVYRDAFVAFALKYYPEVQSKQIPIWVTLERIKAIKSIPVD